MAQTICSALHCCCWSSKWMPLRKNNVSRYSASSSAKLSDSVWLSVQDHAANQNQVIRCTCSVEAELSKFKATLQHISCYICWILLCPRCHVAVPSRDACTCWHITMLLPDEHTMAAGPLAAGTGSAARANLRVSIIYCGQRLAHAWLSMTKLCIHLAVTADIAARADDQASFTLFHRMVIQSESTMPLVSPELVGHAHLP